MPIDRDLGVRPNYLGPDPEPLGERYDVLMRREFPPRRRVAHQQGSPPLGRSFGVTLNRALASWHLARPVEATAARARNVATR